MELSALSNSKEMLRCQTINLIKYLINTKKGRKKKKRRDKNYIKQNINSKIEHKSRDIYNSINYKCN